MNARGVTDIVVISTGLSIGVIDGSAFTVLVMMALITTAMAGPALRWLGLWQPAARPAPAPSDSAPSDSAPSDSAPSDSAPSDSAPSDSVPSDSARSDSAPSDSGVPAAHAQIGG
jgi:hypothetical protein